MLEGGMCEPVGKDGMPARGEGWWLGARWLGNEPSRRAVVCGEGLVAALFFAGLVLLVVQVAVLAGVGQVVGVLVLVGVRVVGVVVAQVGPFGVFAVVGRVVGVAVLGGDDQVLDALVLVGVRLALGLG